MFFFVFYTCIYIYFWQVAGPLLVVGGVAGLEPHHLEQRDRVGEGLAQRVPHGQLRLIGQVQPQRQLILDQLTLQVPRQ